MKSKDFFGLDLSERIKSKTARIGIIGMGYVGLPLALRFAEEKIFVTGFDIDGKKVNALTNGQSYIKHIPSKDVTAASQKYLSATSDFSLVSKMDALIICVPTPLSRYREPDLSYIESSMNSLLPYLKKGQLLSLESTTYPGTTEELLLPKLQEQGFVVGEDFFLVFSPEREDPGNQHFTTKTVPKIVGGQTSACLQLGCQLYQSIIEIVVPVSSTRAAEMTKLLENIHRAVNIGLVNELKTITSKMGIDIHEVIAAASTKPFGFTPYSPGPGLGGHCIPIDPYYFSWKAREFGASAKFIDLAGEVNEAMPEWVIDQVTLALSDKLHKPLRGSKVLVLGLAYKKNIDDMRESPSLRLIQLLKRRGAVVEYSDPFIPHCEKSHEFEFDMTSVPLTSEMLSEFDCVVLSTNHDAFDYVNIQKHSRILVDTRGVYRTHEENVVHA